MDDPIIWNYLGYNMYLNWTYLAIGETVKDEEHDSLQWITYGE